MLLVSSSFTYSQQTPSYTDYYISASAAPGGNGSDLRPWKSFDDIQLDTLTNWIRINVRPNIYTRTNETPFLEIKNKNGVSITKDYRYPGSVILDGGDTVLIGIRIDEDANNPTSNIVIDGLTFRNIKKHAVYVSGDDIYNINNFNLLNCNIQEIGIGDDSTEVSYAGIRIRHTDNILIENNYLKMTREVTGQTDGIQINNNCSNIRIKGNYLEVTNSISNSHIDVIQLAPTCENVEISSNYLKYESNHPDSDNTSGILIIGTGGDILIYNNFVYSKYRKNLIDVHLNAQTTKAWIYNNTLVCADSGYHLMYVKNDGHSSPSDILRIKNNILYKHDESTGGNRPVSIYIEDINPQVINNAQINYNNHFNYNLSPDTMQIIIRYQNTSYLYKFTEIETSGIGQNPLLDSLTGYHLLYNSPCKNKGLGLYNEGVNFIRTDIDGYIRPYWNDDFDIGAFEIIDAQFKIGVTGAGINDVIKHRIKAYGTYWERDSEGAFPISTDSEIDTASYTTIGNSDTTLNNWRGFTYKWLYPSIPDLNSKWGAGFYKVWNDSGAYFYLDARDAITGYSPNIYILYNAFLLPKRYQYYNGVTFSTIENGSIVRIWEINSGNHNTSSLSSYWNNVLIKLQNGDHPWLVWGPYSPASNFTLFRKDSTGSWYSYGTFGTDTYDTVDTDVNIIIVEDPETFLVQYYIGEDASTSNVIEYYVIDPSEKLTANSTGLNNTYHLDQNFPNPFNPSTRIRYSLARDGIVTVKVYNIIGQEVASLINEYKSSGDHEVIFNASSLSSGIYFYRITAGKYTAVKKLQLIK